MSRDDLDLEEFLADIKSWKSIPREPEEIDNFITILKESWRRYPHLRFGQLLSNILSSKSKELFYISDTEFVSKIDEFDGKFNIARD